jgi:hypothetical protein
METIAHSETVEQVVISEEREVGCPMPCTMPRDSCGAYGNWHVILPFSTSRKVLSGRIILQDFGFAINSR